jgi:hypothetical protein
VIVTDNAEKLTDYFTSEDEDTMPFESVGNYSAFDRRRISQKRKLYVETMPVHL